MALIHIDGCLGNCQQGDKPCSMPGVCNSSRKLTPAELDAQIAEREKAWADYIEAHHDAPRPPAVAEAMAIYGWAVAPVVLVIVAALVAALT